MKNWSALHQDRDSLAIFAGVRHHAKPDRSPAASCVTESIESPCVNRSVPLHGCSGASYPPAIRLAFVRHIGDQYRKSRWLSRRLRDTISRVSRELVLFANRTYATPHVIGALIGRTFDRAEISASREFPFPPRFNFNGSCLPFAICKRILDCRCERCRFVVNENGDRRRILPHASRKKIRSSKKNFRTGRVTTSPPPVQLSLLNLVDPGTAVFFR